MTNVTCVRQEVGMLNPDKVVNNVTAIKMDLLAKTVTSQPGNVNVSRAWLVEPAISVLPVIMILLRKDVKVCFQIIELYCIFTVF